MRLEAMPLTTNGKVDRRALPDPAEKRPELDAAYVAPQTEVERKLTGIWGQTLNVQRVGVHDNFFELGGASVPAVQVVARVSDLFGVDFPLHSFFAYPTITEQSEVIEELLLAELEAMSDEEAAALLAEMSD
jgi:acyl carrier protein